MPRILSAVAKELAQRLRPQGLVVRNLSRGGVADVSGDQNPLGRVAVGPVPGGVRRVVVVEDGGGQIEPEAIAFEVQRALPGDDDLALPVVVFADLQEDALEGASVRAGPVEEESQAASDLPEGVRLDDVDDRRRGDSRHLARQRVVGVGEHDVVDQEDEGREGRRRREGRTGDGGRPHAAGPHRDELGVAG